MIVTAARLVPGGTMSMTTTGRSPGLALSLVVHFVAEAVAIWVATLLVSGVHVYGGVVTYLWIAVLFGVINAILGSILRLFTLPLVVLTLGLFSLVISTVMLALTAALSSKLDIDGFWSAFLAALVVAVVSAIVEWILRRVLSR
jgi:putative membrane protein